MGLRFAVLSLCAVGCQQTPDATVADGQPDLVLLLADGLRDGAGPLGTAADAFRDALGLEGRHAYTGAYTHSIEPYVALGALLTGRYPSAIPLCSRPHLAAGQAAAPWCTELSATVRTLPEVLGLYGYEAAFFSARAQDDPSVARGFGTTAVAPPEAAARTWWRAHAAGPRLLVVQAPLALDALIPLVQATEVGAFALAWERERTAPLPTTDPQRYKPLFGGATDDWSAVDDAYVGLAADAGRTFRALLAELPADPRRPRWIATTSLGGVSLGEFTGTEHPEQLVPSETGLLLERTVHVPLDLYDPDGIEAVVDRPVQLVDVAPTFYALAGAVAPAELPGHDLLGAAPDVPRAYAEFGDMLVLRQGLDLISFRAEQHGTSSLNPTLTEALLDPTRAPRPPTWHLSRVTTDPLQREDRLVSDRETADALTAALIAVRRGPGAPPPAALTPERARQLQDVRANGYW